MLLDAATGNVVRRLDDVRLLALSPDGSRILTETVNAQPLDDVNVWDTATGNLLHSISIPAALRDQLLAFDPRAVGIEKYFDPAFSRDGRLVARTLVGNAGGPVTIVWSVESESVEFVAWGLGGAKFSPDGTLLAGSRFDIDRPDTPYQVAVYEL